MRQLVVLRAGAAAASRRDSSLLALRVGRRDQAELAVEDAQQLVEVLRPGRVAGRLQQLGLRPHVPLDVGARSGSSALSTARAAFWC